MREQRPCTPLAVSHILDPTKKYEERAAEADSLATPCHAAASCVSQVKHLLCLREGPVYA